MLKYRNADESLLQELSHEDMRVKAQLLGGYMINPDKTRMVLTSEDENGEQVFAFSLSLLEQEFSEIEAGWFSSASYMHEALFKLSEEGKLDLQNLQKQILNRTDKGKTSFDVSVNLSLITNDQVPASVYDELCGESVYFSIWIKPNAKEDFVHLFDEAEMTLNCKVDEQTG